MTSRALDGDVGAGAHGDADVGGGKRRRVVHAVAGHGDHASFAAQPLHHLRLAVGQHLRLDLVDAEMARDRLRGGAVVAGEHHHAQAFAPQRRQRGGRRFLDRIGDRDHAGELAVERDEDRGRAVAPQALGFRFQRGGRDAELGEERRIAEHDPRAVGHADRALAGR